MENKIILAIESSCDETSAAVVVNGRDVLSNIIASQIDTHKKFGGVVPEVASRMHIEVINSVVSEALKVANKTLDDIDAIAVTYGPGLVGALLVGLQYAKGLAYSLKKPLIGVNHIEGHISANFIEHKDLKPPFVCLVVSGGHTCKIKKMDKIAIAGGVASNSALRESLIKEGKKRNINVLFPSPILCTDNAAMIGSAAYFEFLRGNVASMDLNAKPNLRLGER